MSIIMIDSIDKSGKTTLIEKLRKHIKNCIVINANIRPYNSLASEKKKIKNYYLEVLSFARKSFFKDKTIILDRFFMSQIVYSIKRGSDDFNDNWFKDFEKRILETEHLYIYCYTDLKIIAKRFLTDKEEHLKVDDIKLISDRYEKFYERTKMKKVKIDTLQEDEVNKLFERFENG